MPADVEVEEDLGIIGHEDNNQQPIEDQSFLVVINPEAVVPDSASDSESSSDDEEPVVVQAKRTRKPNVMIGSVAKGKYSAI